MSSGLERSAILSVIWLRIVFFKDDLDQTRLEAGRSAGMCVRRSERRWDAGSACWGTLLDLVLLDLRAVVYVLAGGWRAGGAGWVLRTQAYLYEARKLLFDDWGLATEWCGLFARG